MANDGATLVKRGSGQSGEQPNGMVKQYMKAGTTDTTPTNTIGPYDSGTILGTVPPGKPGLKLVNGTVQNATDLIANSNPLGNTLPSTGSEVVTGVVQSGVPAVNSAQLTSNGLSLNPDHE
jgi:hypothetical protein